jgi:glycine dehydrogenase subunit 1
MSPTTGRIELQSLKAFEGQDITALVIAQPNFFGCLEEVDALVNWAQDHNILTIAVVNPMTLSLLKPPGQWGQKGVDIVVGEGQPLGVPLSSGGPYFGFMTTRHEHVRQLPGRIVGRTIDLDGRSGFALTLQAREQHIRRGKATSNICTNQGLLMSAATIYLSIMGPEGLKRVAQHSYANAQALREKLVAIGITPVFQSNHFHECLYQLPVSAQVFNEHMAGLGFAAGFAVDEFIPELKNTLLVATTETRTEDDLNNYVLAVKQTLKDLGVKP